MPLVRVEVRNEYGLGVSELYREANKEDPKEILDGVAVAGLVGVLRQLGDLAEFAAAVFHGLQEEVMITSSRSRKLMVRVQRIEAALSPVEKAVLAQRSHLHLAYTTGSNWHARISCDQNHFVYSDMPQFIVDSYEDCRDPPALHLLDRFDPGGPGSCLKRYSDPTFFKRVSVVSDEASNKKIAKDNKCLGIKKRRLFHRNGEVSRGASFSYHCGRTQFTQLNVGENATPSQMMPEYNIALRSDLDDQSTSDLRNGSSHVEGDLCPSYSMQTEELESRESISSPVKRHYVDDEFLDYIFLQDQVAHAYDDIQVNLSQEQAGCGSYSVTWDEKTETLEPATLEYDYDGMTQKDCCYRNQESFSTKSELETPGDTTLNFETIDKMDVQPCNETVPTVESGEIDLDDIESETDHFIDAMNTNGLDSGTTVDCMKSLEAEHFSELADRAVDNEVELRRHNSECQSSDSESDGLANSSMYHDSNEHNPSSMSRKSSASNYSINQGAVKEIFSSMSSVDKALEPAQRATESLNPSNRQSVDSFENGSSVGGVADVESVTSTSLPNSRDDRSGVPVIHKTKSNPESQKPALETSKVTSVALWTNGGLLGLEPSKPPDFNVINALPQVPTSTQGDKISTSSQHLIYGDNYAWKPNQIEKFKKIEAGLDTESSMCQEYRESGASFRKPSWKISPADLDIKFGKSSYSLSANNASSTQASVTAPGSSLPVNSMFQAAKKHEENIRSSSEMFELGNRLQTAVSNKKLLQYGFENSAPGSYQNLASEQKYRQSVAYKKISGRNKDLFGCKSPLLSPSSSPPLGHIKISFQPIDGFQTSKLKLKFPDGNNNHETSRDIFPSFQLVPELSIKRHNIGSDSDDDTFCRSLSSLSEDCLSHQSESNSVQWESGEAHSGKDPDLYDALHRISLTESVSTAQENGKRSHGEMHDNYGLRFPLVDYGVQNSKNCNSFDLQSWDRLNHSFMGEPRKYSNSEVIVEPQRTPTPTTPPLPPVQWRGMKPHLDDKEDESEDFAFDLNLSASTISQQPKPAPFKQDQDIESTNMQKSKQSDLQMSKGRREANQCKSIDEKDDFLHQIRSKSLNLRPISTTKQTSGLPPANVQVSAILKKANSIRQAVGSDDGEDDSNWSDP